MLKIKDEADLKKLEEFGFIYDSWRNNYVLCEDSVINDEPLRHYILSVDTVTRIIIFETMLLQEWLFIDILYDLIQAGLVEKVEE